MLLADRSLVLHGFTAVAELKPVLLAVNQPAVLVLHGFTAVAELKRLGIASATNYDVVLHGFTAVAELKLLQRKLLQDHVLQFSTASPPWPN